MENKKKTKDNKKKMSIKELIIKLRKIRANIPLTDGKVAREMTKELIGKLESEKRRKKSVLARSGNHNFYVDRQNVSKEEFERVEREES